MEIFCRCRICINTTKRYVSSTPDNNLKMQAKNVILTQWKLINHLKAYFSKFTIDTTFIDSALNKEFSQFIKKLDPKVYGKDFIRYLSSTFDHHQSKNDEESNNNNNNNNKIKKNEPEKIISSAASSISASFNTVFMNMFRDDSNKLSTAPKIEIPKWKCINKSTSVSKESILSQTSHVLTSLAFAESESAKLMKIENLIEHLKQYPEAKHSAVKEGAIRLLLRTKRNNQEFGDLQSAVNEAFSLLGYANPVAGDGIRILSIDGGGTRGVLVIEMLRKLEELSGKPVYEMFDLICGVSTGAILGSLIGLKQHSLDEAAEIYQRLSSKIFTQSALKGTSNLVLSQSYYNTELWEQLLSSQWDKTLMETNRNLKCPKYCAVSALVNHSRISAYLFRNYALPWRVQSQYLGGYNHQVWEAVRASSAAPTYFEEFKIGNMILQDGGILVNNPTAIAVHEARLLWPNTPIQAVVSFGTGRTVPNPIEPALNNTNNNNNNGTNTSWKNKFLAILNSATDTEGVHTMLQDLLPEGTYYRFNPYLTEMFSMSEIEPEKFEQLKRDAIMYLRRNEDKFQHAAQKLKKTKSITTKCKDWINLQQQIYA